MFHKVKNVIAQSNYKLTVQFSEGVTKIYDMNRLIENNPKFKPIKIVCSLPKKWKNHFFEKLRPHTKRCGAQ